MKISGPTELVETPLFLKHLPDEPYGGSQLVGRSDPYFNEKLEHLRVFGHEHRYKFLKATQLTYSAPKVWATKKRAHAFSEAGVPITNVEFSSKNFGNLVTAVIGRQFKPNTGLDPQVLQNFQNFV